MLKKIMRTIKVVTIILISALTIGWFEGNRVFQCETNNVEKIIFIEGINENIQIITTVKDNQSIEKIINSLNFNKEITFSKHPFKQQLEIYLSNDTKVNLSFESGSIRYSNKQYKLSNQTFNSLVQYIVFP